LADAVYTCDSDAMPLLCPFILIKIEGNFFIQRTLSTILENLELSPTEFQDFCILCGTDFNQKIHGIGPVRAYALIKQYKTIEEIEQHTELDISILNHERVRELFNLPGESFIDKIPPQGQVTIMELTRWLVKNNLTQLSPSTLAAKLGISVK